MTILRPRAAGTPKELRRSIWHRVVPMKLLYPVPPASEGWTRSERHLARDQLPVVGLMGLIPHQSSRVKHMVKCGSLGAPCRRDTWCGGGVFTVFTPFGIRKEAKAWCLGRGTVAHRAVGLGEPTGECSRPHDSSFSAHRHLITLLNSCCHAPTGVIPDSLRDLCAARSFLA